MANPTVNLRRVKRLSGYIYMVDYTINGIRYRKSVGKYKRDAEAVQASIQTQITLGNFDIITQTPIIISLDDLILEYLNEKRNYITPKSSNRYKNYFIPFQRFINLNFPGASKNINLINAHHLRELVDFLVDDKSDKNWQPKTINSMLELISSSFIYAIKKKYIKDNPTIDVKKLPVIQKDVPEYYSYDELEKIWEAVDEYWLPIFKFLYFTGLRKGELINLTWDKVNLKGNTPMVRIASSDEFITKTRKTRTIFLNGEALSILNNQIGTHPKFVFVTPNGKKIHPDKPYKILKKTLKAIKLEGDVHKFRHTFASHLAIKGAKLYDIMKLLGHSNIDTTMIYAHLSPEHQNSVVNLLS